MKVRRDSNGVHVFDRRSGLNILLDEIDIPPHERAWAPRFVSIALTNACDLHCRFCYAPKHVARLDVDAVVAWAIELDEGGCLGLGLGGGEPTLHPDFPELCQRVAAETQLSVSFTTHGHRITDQVVEQLGGSVHFVRVSMDGVGATYERIRGRSFAAFLHKLTLVRSIAPFGINFVVNTGTVGELDDAAALAVEHGAFEMLLLPERPVAGSGGIDSASSRALTRWIRDNAEHRLALSDTAPTDGIPIANPFRDGSGVSAYAHIDASGRLRRSSFSMEGVHVRSSVRAALEELLNRTGETV
ncbi:MAG: radical SAM protein [Chloroflexi bacterium]|nr:radical SAM protein [Chloroflexota bacterium]